MPKMKTRRAAAKRFKVSSKGKISHKQSNSRHNLGHKTRKSKRAFRIDQPIADVEVRTVKRLLCKR